MGLAVGGSPYWDDPGKLRNSVQHQLLNNKFNWQTLSEFSVSLLCWEKKSPNMSEESINMREVADYSFKYQCVFAVTLHKYHFDH